MLLSSKFIRFSLIIFLLPVFSFGQPCNLKLKGRVLDESTGTVLPFSGISNVDTREGVAADSTGYFEIGHLCPGPHHFQFTHIGCETRELTLNMKKDTTIIMFLNHHSELMNEVVIHGKNESNVMQVSSTINAEEVRREGNKNLAEILESIQGVSILKTGSGISKPVIHGLYGNRVTILNNDIVQSGQQWGNDHSPEIDPFIANHISVVKGASALTYSGSSLGGVVLVEPGRISNDSTLNGDVNYIFQSNGMGNTLNTHIERQDRWAAWRVTGTVKLLGDTKAADYFLTNTGRREGDFAFQLEKKISDKWFTSLYYSMFNVNTGILRGAHIGNTTDLEEALTRDEPFYTKDKGSYSIESPRQEVHHHLLKLEANHTISENQSLLFKYGGQIDNRKEFDVRRGGRSDIPALSLWQNSQFLEGIYDHSFLTDYSLKVGAQLNYKDNVNNPETGILPLIPDYRSYEGSSFIIFQNQNNRLSYEFGARYDIKKMNVWAISRTLPRVIEKKNHLYNDYSFSAGTAYRLTNFLKTNFNVGYVLRAPEINELYSFGLHQGVSGIEIGNPELNSEKSLKLILSTDWNIGKKLFIQGLGYFQRINGYIYLQPQNEVELTIRGAFPVFEYEQANAQIIGSDWLLSYEPVNQFKIITKYAILKGVNRSEDIPLIYMPSNNISSTFTCYPRDIKGMQNNSVSLTGEYVFRQKDYVDGQDFIPPPDGYFLLAFNAKTNIKFKQDKNLKISLEVENMLNEKYRDYMNRQRYFADDLGRNAMLKLRYSF